MNINDYIKKKSAPNAYNANDTPIDSNTTQLYDDVAPLYNVAPPLSNDAAPHFNGNAAPQYNGNAAPQFDGNAAPQFNRNAAPQFDGNAAPQFNRNAAPPYNVAPPLFNNAAPQYNGNIAPQFNGNAPQENYATAQRSCFAASGSENISQEPQTPPEYDSETTQQLFDRYSNMNEEQLMQEMFRNASASRANGTLDDSMLDDFYNNACGYLTPEQSERMKDLIRELKK